MNYRHVYHAGSFSDVIKHLVLTILIQSLQRKETPFCFLDTHAGIGLYELDSEEAQKKQEYQNGIAKLFLSDEKNFPEIIQPYLSIVKKYNKLLSKPESDGMLSSGAAGVPLGDGCREHESVPAPRFQKRPNTKNELHFYPGSPFIAESLLRENDQMILCELHKEDIKILKENMRRAKNIAIHHTDGYLGMKAFLPPKQKRGLVLIDPPFEKTDEFDHIFQSLKKALKHWRSGHFMIWYPIKDHDTINDFYDNIESLHVENLIIHFSLNEISETEKLFSCGILLINPPYQIKETLEICLPILSGTLQARWEILTV